MHLQIRLRICHLHEKCSNAPQKNLSINSTCIRNEISNRCRACWRMHGNRYAIDNNKRPPCREWMHCHASNKPQPIHSTAVSSVRGSHRLDGRPHINARARTAAQRHSRQANGNSAQRTAVLGPRKIVNKPHVLSHNATTNHSKDFRKKHYAHLAGEFRVEKNAIQYGNLSNIRFRWKIENISANNEVKF